MQPLLHLHLPFRHRLAPLPAPVAAGPGRDAVVLPTDGRPLALRVRRPVRLRVHGGRAWITRDGCPEDHWLEPGQTLALTVAASWFGSRIFVSGEGASLVTLTAEAMP